MKNIFFLGCGKMGSILAKNLIEKKTYKPSQIKILKKSPIQLFEGPSHIKKISDLPKSYQADLVFICIKPQNSEEILLEFAKAKIFHKNTIFISILAGKKIRFFEKIFGQEAKIIRAMPNTPIQYSQGIFAFFCNKNLITSEVKTLTKTFSKFGTVFKTGDEKLFDVITAIFGSGPAYIFLLQEIFTEILSQFKINSTAATKLIKKLFLGSSLMSEKSEKSFSELRKSVTSKGGTTEAALEILQKKSALKNLFGKAIKSATKKSKTLSDE